MTTADDSAEWLARGEAQRKAGRPVDAMLAYRRALRSKEHAVQAHFHLGELLHDVGRDAEAFAAWRAALTQQPEHVPSLLAFAAAMRRSGDFAEAARACRRVLACEPQHVGARVELALAKLPQGDAAAYSELATLLRDDANVECLEEVARCLAVAPWSPARHMLLVALDATRRVNLPPLLLAIAAQDAAEASEPERARLLLDRASEPAPAMEDPEALRRLALSAATIGAESSWAERYAEGCAQAFAPAVPWLWPRRAAGDALRVAYLLAPGHTLRIGHIEVEPRAYIRSIVAAHSHAQIAAAVWIVDGATLDEETTAVLGGLPVATLGHAPAPGLARLLAEADYDVLIGLELTDFWNTVNAVDLCRACGRTCAAAGDAPASRGHGRGLRDTVSAPTSARSQAGRGLRHRVLVHRASGLVARGVGTTVARGGAGAPGARRAKRR